MRIPNVVLAVDALAVAPGPEFPASTDVDWSRITITSKHHEPPSIVIDLDARRIVGTVACEMSDEELQQAQDMIDALGVKAARGGGVGTPLRLVRARAISPPATQLSTVRPHHREATMLRARLAAAELARDVCGASE